MVFRAVPALFPLSTLAASKLNTVIGNLIDVAKQLIILVFVLAVVMFGWGIVQFLRAASSGPEQLKKSKQFLLWGVVGMAVLASIYGLITYLTDIFGVTTGGGTIKPPQF